MKAIITDGYKSSISIVSGNSLWSRYTNGGRVTEESSRNVSCLLWAC